MDLGMRNVIILVPCYNEGKIIYETLSNLLREKYTVVVIDDGSFDNTAIEIAKTSAIILRHSTNLGQGAALETGLEYVRRNIKNYDYVCTFDADGQHSVSDIKVLINAIQQTEFNVILGNRFGNQKYEGGLLKGFLLKLSAKISKFSIGLQITDRHNGLRVLDKKAVNLINLKVPGYGHADELLRNLVKYGLTYGEAPVSIRYTNYSKSKGQPLYNLITILFDKAMIRK